MGSPRRFILDFYFKKRMKQGGTSLNQKSDKGMKSVRYKCSICGRSYGMEWAKANHEKACKIFNKAK